jgi:4-amino-4-deoxy-L-arabinose transferase-like glycosyltransferase
VLLALLICLPWYVMAEIRNPGFLRYFIVNEHILRYLRPDFGEQYGSTGHTYMRGMIWGMMFAGFLPWSPLLLFAAWRAVRRKLWRRLAGGRDAEALLIGWLLAPLVLFTPARSVMITYILPAIPACAILAGRLLASYAERSRESLRLAGLRPLDPFYLLAIPALFCLPGAGVALLYVDRVYDLPLGYYFGDGAGRRLQCGAAGAGAAAAAFP